MVCFGGLDANNNILDDMIYFNVNVGDWPCFFTGLVC
jgi:hypothetical protein